MKVQYESALENPDYIIQSNYSDCCCFWPFSNEEGIIEENKCADFDIGVWRITYKHN